MNCMSASSLAKEGGGAFALDFFLLLDLVGELGGGGLDFLPDGRIEKERKRLIGPGPDFFFAGGNAEVIGVLT